MVKVAEVFIVGKGKRWLMTLRADIQELPAAHVWSAYAYDAAKFDKKGDAKRKARRVEGEVYSFIPATGKIEKVIREVPEGAVCDSCWGYVPYNGKCRNKESEFCGEYVSCNDCCDEWEERKRGRERQTDSAADTGCGEVEEPGR